MNKFDASRIRR